MKEGHLPSEAPLVPREGRASSFITHLATKAPSHLGTAGGLWLLGATGRQGLYQGTRRNSFNSPLGGPVVVEVSVNRSWGGLFRAAPCISSLHACSAAPQPCCAPLHPALLPHASYSCPPHCCSFATPPPQHPSSQSKVTFRMGGLQKGQPQLASGHHDHKSPSPYLGA